MSEYRGLAVILAIKILPDVALEVNLRNLLHAGTEAHKQEDPSWLSNPSQISAEVHTWVKVVHKKDKCHQY